MKKIFFLIMLVLFIVSCGKQADNTVEKFIDNIKNKKIDAALKYTKNEDYIRSLNMIEISYGNKTQEAIFEALFKNMNYKVLQSKKESDELTIVKVEIENVDVKEVFNKLFIAALQHNISTADNYDSLEKKLIEIISAKDVPKVKYTTDFRVYKTQNGNKIDLTSDNIDVMFARVYSSIDSFAKSEDHVESNQPVSTENNQPTPQPMQKK